jgi:transcriptional regulator with XRE-family HTH domain
MLDDAAHDDVRATLPLRTMADKVNWLISLISTARPAGLGPYGNAEVAVLIREATGEPVTGMTIRKLRSGQAASPQLRLIEAMARFFGVPPGFFFDDYDESQVSLLQEQVELLAMIRRSGITPAELRVLLRLSPEARQSFFDFVTVAVRDAGRHRDAPGEDA